MGQGENTYLYGEEDEGEDAHTQDDLDGLQQRRHPHQREVVREPVAGNLQYRNVNGIVKKS